MPSKNVDLDGKRFDVVVVGAGLGGLVAAGLLARAGRKVLVAEQHYLAGGNTTCFRRKGYHFDVGLHYIGECGERGWLRRILAAAGADVEYETLDPQGYDTLICPDFTFRFPAGIPELRGALLRQFPDERWGIDRYIKALRQLTLLQKLEHNPLKFWHILPRTLLLLRYMNGTFGAFLDSCKVSKPLRAVLASQAGDYGLPPDQASVIIGLGLTAHYANGAYYPRGGGQGISDRIVESIEAAGGTVLLSTPVTRIHVASGRVRGVEIENKKHGKQTIHASVVVSNADIKRTVKQLVGPEHFSPKTVQRVEEYRMSPALGAVYLGVNRDLSKEDIPMTNFWLFPDYDQERRWDDLEAGEFGDEPVCYISIASLKDPSNPSLAPEGKTNLELMSLAPAQPEAWGVTAEQVRTGEYRKVPAYLERKQEYADGLIRAASKKFPWLADEIDFMEVATPLTHTRFTSSTGGTSYGIASTPDQMLGRRPGCKTEVKGLYLAGASLRTGHGIAGVALSGAAVARQLLPGNVVRDLFNG